MPFSSRYKNKQALINNSDKYAPFRKSRGIKTLTQHQTFDMSRLQNLKTANLFKVVHVVQPFERLSHISQKYYNAPEYGWLICATNAIANEMLISEGMSLMIYLPLQDVLGVLNA